MIRTEDVGKDDPSDPCVEMWRAVVALAIADACGAGEERDEARAWLLGNSRDFRMVVALAGLDSDAVMESAIKMQAGGWKRPKVEKEVAEAC
jgi:hypothetical protein